MVINVIHHNIHIVETCWVLAPGSVNMHQGPHGHDTPVVRNSQNNEAHNILGVNINEQLR